MAEEERPWERGWEQRRRGGYEVEELAPEEYERRFLAGCFQTTRTLPHRFVIDEIYLAGSYPDTEVIHLISHEERPGCRFGWGAHVWHAGIDPHPEFEGSLRHVYLQEYAGGWLQLLERSCEPGEISWALSEPSQFPGAELRGREVVPLDPRSPWERHWEKQRRAGYEFEEIEVEEYERRLLAASLETPPTLPHGFVIDEIKLAARYPKTELIHLISHERKPGCRFGWSTGVWRPGMGPRPEAEAGLHSDYMQQRSDRWKQILEEPCKVGEITWVFRSELSLWFAG